MNRSRSMASESRLSVRQLRFFLKVVSPTLLTLLLAFAVRVFAVPGDVAVAGGKVAGNAQISFAAFSGPNGENPEGEVEVISLDPADDKQFHGKVTCLLVEGHRATIVHQITQSNVLELEGKYQILWVEDNGQPIMGEPVDTYSSNGYFDTPPTCAFTPGFTVLFEGNITIKDR